MNLNRIIKLNNGSHFRKGKYIIYWMQQSQRTHFNHALLHAIDIANREDLPLIVFFGLTANYPDANLRHYQFMLEGLKEVKEELKSMDIKWVLKLDSPEIGILPFLKDAAYLIADQGYLRHQKMWRQSILEYIKIHQDQLPYDLVDTDTIVPVHITSNKAEYGAFTIRPKIKNLYQNFRDFHEMPQIQVKNQSLFDSDDDHLDIEHLIQKLTLDSMVKPSRYYRGGYKEALTTLDDFIDTKLNHYKESNDPSLGYTSKLSLYIHFGQISTLEILERLLEIQETKRIDGESFDNFIEQIMVRRELAINYVYYTEGYDQFNHMTETWAYMTMRAHELDPRPYLYTRKEIQTYKTHDPYFNAAMKEMVVTGYMHNYMRMYWAKKIIEWTSSYEIAYQMIIDLNNKYFIDGRDANSYAGVAWCFGKHDRAWTEREVFGKLRYMNEGGLKRKFNIEAYVKQIDDLYII